ncbi:MAG: hypothetical protein ACYCX2_09615 [Christensenellales bacterium]
MIKRNNLRKIYMVYSMIVGELFALAVILCAGSILNGVLLNILWILAIAAMICVPAIMYLCYKWRKKDNASSSDELEQLVLTKAFAAAGFVAISLLPALFLLAFLLSGAAGYVAFGYAIVVAGTLKCSMYYYYKKF